MGLTLFLQRGFTHVLCHAAVFSLVLGVGVGCSVGNGEGWVEGTVNAADCGLEQHDFNMEAQFFAAQDVEDALEIRLQSKSDMSLFSDGVTIFVRDAAQLQRESLGQATPVVPGDSAPVELVMYLNETCKTGPKELPVAMSAFAGSITFEAIYAPRIDGDARSIVGFFDASFADPKNASERHAMLRGTFEFKYTRGRPAQWFP